MVAGRRRHQHLPFARPAGGPSRFGRGVSVGVGGGIVVSVGVGGGVVRAIVVGGGVSVGVGVGGGIVVSARPRAIGSAPPRGPPAMADRSRYHEELFW
jgi:hypothetical protein